MTPLSQMVAIDPLSSDNIGEEIKIGRIVVAEDQPINLQVIKNQIETLGLTSITEFCVDGQDTVERVQKILDEDPQNECPVGLILTDFQMPRLTGLQVVDKIREMYESKAQSTGVKL